MRADPLTDSSESGKRRAQRKPVVAFVWYKLISGVAGGESAKVSGLARSCDVSDGGIGIVTSEHLPLGVRVFLEIATAIGNVSAVGAIMHCSEVERGYFRSGIQIEIVPPNDRALLPRLLEK